jgi:hypothetical protein
MEDKRIVPRQRQKMVFYLKADLGQHVRIKQEKSVCYVHLNKRWAELTKLRTAKKSAYIEIYLTKEEYEFIRQEHLLGVKVKHYFELSLDSTYNVLLRYYLPHVKKPEPSNLKIVHSPKKEEK